MISLNRYVKQSLQYYAGLDYGIFIIQGIDETRQTISITEGCRDSLHYYWSSFTKRGCQLDWGIYLPEGRKQYLLKTFRALEEKLKIPQEDKLVLKKSDDNRAFFFDIPKFWCKNDGRFSLFSLLLRYGVGYAMVNVLDRSNLREYRLIDDTYGSIEYFLDGNVNLTEMALDVFYPADGCGWHSVFVDVNKKDLPLYLTK